ncbi:MAG: 6-phosphogluconolactonase [Jaaginema sp. PMC 1079.18]|nr:6-phosphogluconolactonase [Jaaginema sp. PMC 1080.18]MEC4850071.1 6-phosphogluconolactonase [Jaaginema sp. PMC 1079.18]MEC4864626.1 6-phosphogluconolactonase [Jaaginema sp. PMC 1078.18]
MESTVEILDDKSALIARSHHLIVEKLQDAIAQRGQATIALAGGSTPRPLYESLAEQDLPWEKIHVFWGDERYVALTHTDSNQGMARKAWLSKVNIPETNIHPMPTGANNPQVNAAEHSVQLQQFFGVQSGEFPAFDVILLGIGDDAHTASLFPHTDALKVRDRLVTVGNKDGQPRITFTIPLINQAHCVIFLIAGASKQDALAHIFAENDDPHQYPARLIQPQGQLYWLLDRAAGENLSTPKNQ